MRLDAKAKGVKWLKPRRWKKPAGKKWKKPTGRRWQKPKGSKVAMPVRSKAVLEAFKLFETKSQAIRE